MVVIPDDSTSTSMKVPQATIVAQSKIMRTRELMTSSSNHTPEEGLYVMSSVIITLLLVLTMLSH